MSLSRTSDNNFLTADKYKYFMNY